MIRRLFTIRTLRAFVTLSLAVGIQSAVLAAEPSAQQRQQAERQFTRKVLPLLKSKCFACHGEKPDEIKGQFDLTNRAGLLRGGESEEPAVVPGKPEAS